MPRPLVSLLLAGTVLGASCSALACGEGVYYMGDGLRYQGYLAPRPATVLIYDTEITPESDRIAVYRGLVQAGHSLTVARDSDQLAQALGERRYDVVIAGLDSADTVVAAAPSATPAPKLLPVVAASERNAPGLRERFEGFLLDGASLGQYLKHINRLMKD